MVEPVSVAAVAAKASKAAAVAEGAAEGATALEVAEVGREVSEIALHEQLDRVNEISKMKESAEFQARFLETVNSSSSFDKLETTSKELKAGGSESAKAYRELKNSPNIKGQLGEALSVAKKEGIGNIETQVAYEGGRNKLDLLLETDRATKFETLSINQFGELVKEAVYLPAEDKVAVEVKNGGLNYLNSEVQKGHLLEQIEAGKDLASNSFVEINQDVFNELTKNTELTKNIVNKVNEAGGEIIVGLPGYKEQIEFFINSVKGG